MDDNPYRTPRAELEPVAPGLVESGSLYRKVYLPPPLDLVIEYQGVGWGETVSVNGTVADDAQRWWRLRGNEATAPVKPGNARELVIAPQFAAGVVNIWCGDIKSSGYLMHVVTEQELKKQGK